MFRGLAFLFLMCFSYPVVAQEVDRGLELRLELADQMLAINPPRDQVRSAIEGYIRTYMLASPPLEKEQFRTAMLSIINYKALEGLTREAYVDFFTEAELSAMVEYYSKPEALSARSKLKEFEGRVYPEIIRMIDQAIMRARTTSR